MAKVILSLEGSVIREVSLDKERVTIGRKPQNDIQIENLAVSSEHARLEPDQHGWRLVDLGSRFGTLVNGIPATTRHLEDLDRITVADCEFIFEAADVR